MEPGSEMGLAKADGEKYHIDANLDEELKSDYVRQSETSSCDHSTALKHFSPMRKALLRGMV
jgi:hypothetical protein